MSSRYQASQELLTRAEKTVPLGSQTFSKSRLSFPYGASPFLLDRGKGARVWDVDNNSYLDFINGLLCISLGYQDQDVDTAVKKQMSSGVSFSLPHRLEMEVAEMLVELIPCAEQVRFGKNGSDVTSAAVRLSRAYTGREHIAVCGYHGWHDWYIGSTSRNLGVPKSTKALTHNFTYNDISSLEAIFSSHPGKIAAVILEPMSLQFPKPGFLAKVKELAHKNGTLLIFDEIITGFRLDLKGAQHLFGITPDLATFGKGVANGYPLSAIVGRKDIMTLMEDIFFSGTFGGETLSLAAAKATISKMQNSHVIEHIHQLGHRLQQGLAEHTRSNGFFSFTGHPAWTGLCIADGRNYTSIELKSLFLQEMFKRGILIGGTHNLSYAHQAGDIDQLIAAYAEVIPLVTQAEKDKCLHKLLEGRTIEPIFKVR